MGEAAKDMSTTVLPEMMPGEFGALLERIELEPVPERLFELAVQLQAALQLNRQARQQPVGEQRALVDG